MRRLFYKDIDTPVGALKLIASDGGLVAILWEGEDYTRIKLDAPILNNAHPMLLLTAEQLAEYFAKKGWCLMCHLI